MGTTLRFRLNEHTVSAWVARTGASLRWRKPVSRRAHIEVTSAVAGNTAIGHSEYNRTMASLSLGPRIRYFVGGAGEQPLFGLINMDIGVCQQFHGGDGYSHTAWIGLGFDQTVAPDWRIGTCASRWVTGDNDLADSVEPTGMSPCFGVSRRLAPGWLTLAGPISGEHTKRENQRRAGREAIVFYGATLWQDLRVAGRTTLGDREYDGKEALVQKPRKDDTYGLDVKLSQRAISFEGVLPELNLGWSKT